MLQKGLEIKRKRESHANWRKQLSILTQRSFTNMWRDLGYYWVRIGIYLVLSICVGTVFSGVGKGYTAILARGACGGFISGFMTFMSIGGFPSFIEELKVNNFFCFRHDSRLVSKLISSMFCLVVFKQVFSKERLNGHYGVGLYILSNSLASFPYLTVMSVATASIIFYMVKFRPEFSHLVYACLDLMASIAAVESSMMTIASLVPNFLMGVIIGAGYVVRLHPYTCFSCVIIIHSPKGNDYFFGVCFQGIMMITSGFFRRLPDLPKVFWRYPVSYINYGAWGLQVKEEFTL